MDYLALRRREFETTLRVLQAYPEDQAQLKPAAKSRTAVMVNAWQQAVAKNDAMLAALSADDFGASVDFYGRRISLDDALWLELLDHIHHRGQFSVYLRVAGAKVPSIYGPTADFEWPGLT
jgi:uncharacterized damage-inducible protein DinB